MKFSYLNSFRKKREATITVLAASGKPDKRVLEVLSKEKDLRIKEAFSTRGVLQSLNAVHLLILGELLPVSEVSPEILQATLDHSGIPLVSEQDFLSDPEEWLGRARLSQSKEVHFLPSRQINFVNWAGGVGKTTLAMAVCKRFVQKSGLPAALLELSLGGSSYHARISEDLPEFFSIATRNTPPSIWNGVSIYPMDGRSFEVLCPQGLKGESEDIKTVRNLLNDIRRKHTLLVVDCFPGHPLFSELSVPENGRLNLVVTSPREDALFQARRLLDELSEPRYLVMNRARSVADRAESSLAVKLPDRQNWAESLDPRLADPLLELTYPGWKRRKA